MIGAVFAFMALMLPVLIFASKKFDDALKPGMDHYNQGNYTAAETDFRQYNQNTWTAGELIGHYYLALCLLHEGRIENARAELDWVSTHNSGKGSARYSRGAEKLLKALDELPASPAAAQTQQWQLKYLTQHQRH